MAFQEESDSAVLREDVIGIPKSKRRSIQLHTEKVNRTVKVNPKVEPPSFIGMNVGEPRTNGNVLCERLLLLWKSVRYLNCNDQTNPRFVGWIVQQFQQADSKATRMTYLPPIQTPIIEYATIIEMFYVSRQVAKQSNMLYMDITLDAGAACKAFHVVWNNPIAWSDIIIHLGISMHS